jgi:hypothetical protein
MITASASKRSPTWSVTPSTRTTEVVYRWELRPVITTGAEIMDDVFRRQ